MKEGTTMFQTSELAPEQLEAQIGKWHRAVKAGNGAPQARTTLKTLLLERERRHIAAFTDGQLGAAISRYDKKVSAGDRGAAQVLERLTQERVRRCGASRDVGTSVEPGAAPGLGQVARASAALCEPRHVRAMGTAADQSAVPAGSGRFDRSGTASAAALAPEATAKYKGVGGWLLFFCVCLTVVNPVLTTAVIVAGASEASQYFGRFPGLRAVCVLDGLLSAGVMAFGVYAGVSLWMIKRNAVDIAKAYLVVFLISSVVSNLVLPLLAGLPAEATGAILQEGFRGMIWPYIGFSIWNAYFKKSKRVKATFARC